jgi:MFS family permease
VNLPTEPPESVTHISQRRSVIILLLNIGAFGAMNSVLVSLLPLLGTELGMSATQVTSIGTCAALGVFLCSPFWGRQSDHLGRKKLIALGMAGYAVMSLVLITVLHLAFGGSLHGHHLYLALWASRVGQALLLAAMLPAATAYMIDITTLEQRTVGLSRIGASHGLGSIAGPLLISLSAFGWLMPLYAAVTLAVTMAVIVWWKLEEPHHNAHRQKPTQKMRFLDPRYREILAVGVSVYIALAVSNQTMGFYLPRVLGLSPQQAATSLAMTQATLALAMVTVQLLVIPRLGWPPYRYLMTGVPLVAAGFLCLLLAQHLAVFMLATALIGLGFGLAGPGYSSEVSLRVRPEEQGALAGLTSACPALGFVVGPLSAGLLYDLHPRLPYAVTLLLLLVLAAVIWRLQPKAAHAS